MLVLHTLIDDARLFAGPDACADHDDSQEKMLTCPHYWVMPNVSQDTWRAKVIVLGNPFFVIIYIDSSLPEPMGQGESFSLILFFPVTFSFQGIREILTIEFTILFN